MVISTRQQAIDRAIFWLRRGRTIDADFAARQICVTQVWLRNTDWVIPMVQPEERCALYSHRYLTVDWATGRLWNGGIGYYAASPPQGCKLASWRQR